MKFPNHKYHRYLRDWPRMVIPAMVMILIAWLGFSDFLLLQQGKTLFLTGLLVIYPGIFIYWGSYTARNNLPHLLYAIPSYLAYTLVFFVWLNSSALVYFILYLAAYAAGYAFIRFDERLNKKEEEKKNKNRFYAGK